MPERVIGYQVDIMLDGVKDNMQNSGYNIIYGYDGGGSGKGGV